MSTLSPQEQAAHLFMTHKGFPDLTPFEIEKLDGHNCWYFLYRLPEGVLELEVSWDEVTEEWGTMVTTFASERSFG